jgi:hypothetical protein
MRIKRIVRKEDPHASNRNQLCPPPRRRRPAPLTQPGPLWQALPAAQRDGILNALGRVVVAHLTRPPRPEVTHERP